MEHNDKLVIIVAAGAPPSELEEYPDLPRTPEQIAETVLEAHAAGASIAHLHVIDDQGQATTDLSCFRKTLDLIREKCDIVIEGSTGGVAELSVQERCIALDADIELASLNPGSCNHAYGRKQDKHIVRGDTHLSTSLEGVYINSPHDIDFWVRRMHERGIKPTPAIFEVGFIENSVRYIRDGLIEAPVLFNLVLGLPGAIPATSTNLQFMINSLPPESYWVATGYRYYSHTAMSWAVALGGWVRVGFEDCVDYLPGQRAESNAQLVERVARIAKEVSRPLATPADVRDMLKLK